MENIQEKIYQDILHVSHGPFARLTEGDQKKIFPGALIRAGRHFLKLLKDWLFFRTKLLVGKEDIRHKIWLVIGSKNNRDSLAFLKDQLPEATFVATHQGAVALGPYTLISYHFAFLQLWRFWPLFIRLYPIFGQMLWRKIDVFTKAVGLYEAAIAILKKGQPKALIFSNDHDPHMRALLWAAKKTGVPTVYLQHASVSEYFPPLLFDLNLLEGEDSLQKYRACGPVEGQVKLIGMPKFDHYLAHRNHFGRILRIGVCIGLLDEKHRVETLIQALQARFSDLALSFRSHPRETRSFDLPGEWLISDSKTEGIFDFLQRQDLIIAGDTSTHLEAVLLNVVSLYFSLNDQLADYYGYIKKGLIPRFDTVESLVEYLQEIREQKPEVFTRAKFYNAAVATPNEGASSEMAVKAILSLLER